MMKNLNVILMAVDVAFRFSLVEQYLAVGFLSSRFRFQRKNEPMPQIAATSQISNTAFTGISPRRTSRWER